MINIVGSFHRRRYLYSIVDGSHDRNYPNGDLSTWAAISLKDLSDWRHSNYRFAEEPNRLYYKIRPFAWCLRGVFVEPAPPQDYPLPKYGRHSFWQPCQQRSDTWHHIPPVFEFSCCAESFQCQFRMNTTQYLHFSKFCIQTQVLTKLRAGNSFLPAWSFKSCWSMSLSSPPTVHQSGGGQLSRFSA